MSLRDKVAVITGAASGLGKASALRFAAEGASVAVVDINEEGAAATVDQITTAGGSALALRVDVTEEGQVSAALARVVDEFGGVDILFSNAGIPMAIPITELTVAQWDTVMSINVKGAFLTAKHGVPILERRGGGVILITGSIAGLVGLESQPAYCASKGALAMLTKALAVDLAPLKIRVNCICPGSVDTPALRTFLVQRFGTEHPVEHHLSTYGNRYPLGRIGTTEEIAAAAAFLASDDAAWITGQVLAVDGGYVAR
jgi:NAD(P)-dependent dehydrogenase (short-subunit alcohol dehydrogenase family)